MEKIQSELRELKVFHDIVIKEFGQACVSFRSVAHGVEVAVSCCLDIHDPNSCTLSTHGDLVRFPSVFRHDLDADLASAIATKLLKEDHLLALRFSSGRLAKVTVPASSQESIVGSPRDLDDVRRRARTLGAMIRPCLQGSFPELERLHDYQKVGVDWLVGKSSAVLADDMGLGKTIQAITALRMSFNRRPLNTALIVCPRQLLANWESELKVWAPELSWSRLTPPTRWRTRAWTVLFNRIHLIITNYEQLGAILDEGFDPSFSVVVLDEAHRLRNSAAQVTNHLRRITRDRTWALTGTPIERSPSDLWTILSIVEPRRFNVAYIPTSEESVKARARPYTLRRMKRDFLPTLPPEIQEHEIIELLPQQRKAYDRALVRFKTSPDRELLAWLNKLRTLCDFDSESGQSAKLERIIDILRAVKANGEKAVVFSYLLGPLDMIGTWLDEEQLEYAHIRGEQTIDERELALVRFNRDEAVSFLLASTRVGGEGLNLVEANHVVFVNRWWNPSANRQAKDRVSRIGQERTVVVHSFTCRDTVEEVLDDIIAEKDRMTHVIVEAMATPAGAAPLIREIAMRLNGGDVQTPSHDVPTA